MSEMRVDDAIDIVARRMLWRLVAADNDASFAVNEWSEFPAIGEFDWAAVLDRLDEMAPRVDNDKYDEAYRLLANRSASEA